MNMKSTRIASWLLIITVSIYFLIAAKDLLIPFVLSIGLWMMINGIIKLLNHVDFIRKYFPDWAILLMAIAAIFYGVELIVSLIVHNATEIVELSNNRNISASEIVNNILSKFGADTAGLNLEKYFSNINLKDYLSEILNQLTYLTSNIFMVVIYAVFFMLEQSTFKQKLVALFPESDRFSMVNRVSKKIIHSIESYIAIKTIVSLITAFLSYLVLVLMNVDFAFFWAFLIFLFNYIPNIGSIAATLFPTVTALLQFETFYPALAVMIMVGAIQVIVGSFLEPRIMGNTLNLSSLVVLLSLSIWGSMWGIIGMFLSVPITVVIMIICSQFDKTKPIAILLSERGKISDY